MTQAYTLQSVRREVDAFLADYFADKAARASQLDPRYGSLWKAMATLYASGGKRLRPYMTVLTYRGFGGTGQKSIVQVAAALEVLHLSMLIHDDIIDRDYVRHGADNIAGTYLKHYAAALPDRTERLHFANSAAMLAGDLGLSEAYQLIMQSGFSAVQKSQAHRILSTAVFTVIGGELLDTESAFRPSAEVDSLKTALLKTASYSFVTPLLMGATLAGAPAPERRKLTEYGEALGIAYQLADDLLELFGDPKLLGKPVSSDIREGKLTYVMQQALQTGAAAEEILELVLGRQDVTAKDMKAVRDIIIRSGAKARTEQQIKHFSQQAQKIGATIGADETARRALQKLVTDLAKRTY